MLKTISILLVLSTLQACVAYPEKVFHKDDERCQLKSRYYDFRVNKNGLKMLTRTNDPASALFFSGVVFSVTAVVSGSIVLIGNTVHFLEKQGKCEDSFLNQEILKHNKPLLEKEGEVIGSL